MYVRTGGIGIQRLGMSEEKTIIANAEDLRILQQPQKRSRACLVQYSGRAMGKRYPLEKPAQIIGRSPQKADIVIDDQSVSRAHTRLHLRGEDAEVEDMGSSNGTYINDKITDGRVRLRDQDVLRLGTVLLKFFAQETIDIILQDKIYRMATIDAGTEVFNKGYLKEALDKEFNSSQAFGTDFSLIYYDLDFFKKVNDTFGHNAGDLILKETAAIVKKTVRKDDILGRWGGEEFIILLPNTNGTVAIELAERIRVAIEQRVFNFEVQQDGIHKKVSHRQTISLGVSQLDRSMVKPTDLMEDADKKLYTSKQTGRNKVTG